MVLRLDRVPAGPIDPLPGSLEFFAGFADELEGPDGERVRRLYVQGKGARAIPRDLGVILLGLPTGGL